MTATAFCSDGHSILHSQRARRKASAHADSDAVRVRGLHRQSRTLELLNSDAGFRPGLSWVIFRWALSGGGLKSMARAAHASKASTSDAIENASFCATANSSQELTSPKKLRLPNYTTGAWRTLVTRAEAAKPYDRK